MSEEKIDELIKLVNGLNGKVDDLFDLINDLGEKMASAPPPAAAPAATPAPSEVAKEEPTPSAGTATIVSDSGAKSPSKIAWEQKEKKEGKVETGGRLACPKCGAVGQYVAQVDDKETILNYIAGTPQYGKKYYCKKCAHQWK